MFISFTALRLHFIFYWEVGNIFSKSWNMRKMSFLFSHWHFPILEFPGGSRYINGNSACQDLFKDLLESDFLPSKLSSILFPLQPSATSLHLCSYLRMLPLEETGLSNIYDDSIIIAFIILSSSLCFGQPSFPPPTSSLAPLAKRLLQTSVEPYRAAHHRGVQNSLLPNLFGSAPLLSKGAWS